MESAVIDSHKIERPSACDGRPFCNCPVVGHPMLAVPSSNREEVIVLCG
jgi:hypothetical protein